MRVAQSGEPQPPTLWQRFTQQRLRAWQPLLAPHWVVSTYAASGLAFVCLGVSLLLVSQQAAEYARDYTDAADRSTGLGSFDIEIAQDMQPPIWVYYQLDGFHQNHRRYVQSRDEKQLSNASQRYAADQLPHCRPWAGGEDGRVHYPCGLVARSVFNDTFALVLRRSGEGAPVRELLTVDSSAQTIAWPADSVGRFRNLDPEKPAPGQAGDNNALALDMWILERFPPVTCEQTEISEARPYAPVAVARRNETRNGQWVEVADCSGYTSASPSCKFVRDGAHFECTGHYREVRQRDWGVESGHFIVWMRVAGLPSFRKLWGRLDTPLPAGSVLEVHFQDSFEVREFGGRKALVVSTSSVLGGRNDFLGWGFVAVGSCCLIFSVVLLSKYTVHGPRPLGDPTLLTPVER